MKLLSKLSRRSWALPISFILVHYYHYRINKKLVDFQSTCINLLVLMLCTLLFILICYGYDDIWLSKCFNAKLGTQHLLGQPNGHDLYIVVELDYVSRYTA